MKIYFIITSLTTAVAAWNMTNGYLTLVITGSVTQRSY
jgi:hypothetical protein